MSTVQEIESAISRLAPADYSKVRDWLLDHDNRLWDRQLEEDALAGRHAHLVSEIESEIALGKVKPLDEVINNG